jgi:hypothetical protein
MQTADTNFYLLSFSFYLAYSENLCLNENHLHHNH